MPEFPEEVVFCYPFLQYPYRQKKVLSFLTGFALVSSIFLHLFRGIWLNFLATLLENDAFYSRCIIEKNFSINKGYLHLKFIFPLSVKIPNLTLKQFLGNSISLDEDTCLPPVLSHLYSLPVLTA